MLPLPGGECLPLAVMIPPTRYLRVICALFADPAPQLAAAQHAGAAVDLQRIGALHQQAAGVTLAIVGIIDRSCPDTVAVEVHRKDAHADDLAAALGRIRIFVVDRRFARRRIGGVLCPDPPAAPRLAAMF